MNEKSIIINPLTSHIPRDILEEAEYLAFSMVDIEAVGTRDGNHFIDITKAQLLLGPALLAQRQYQQKTIDALTEENTELKECVNFTLTDFNRLLRKSDAEPFCQSPELCFEAGDRVVRCGPCAIAQSRSCLVEVDSTMPALAEVSRLKRELKKTEAEINRLRDIINEKQYI